MEFIAFLGFCVLGWKVFALLRIPTPTILGPMVAVCVGNLLGLPIGTPFWARPALSVVMGVMLGLRFHIRAKGLVKEICLAVGWIIALSLITAQVLQMAGMSKSTAIFAAMPGGLAELSLMAISFGADTLAVALLQSIRMLTAMFFIPLIAAKLPRPDTAPVSQRAESRPVYPFEWAVMAVLTAVSAFLLSFADIPAAMLVGPMLAVGMFTQLRGFSVKLPKLPQQIVQMGIGGLVGLGVTAESLRGAERFLLPILYLDMLIVGGSFVLAFLLHKVSGWDRTTCLLCSSPAGLSPTIMLSIELNADSGKVALFQLLRMFTVLLFAPIAARLLL